MTDSENGPPAFSRPSPDRAASGWRWASARCSPRCSGGCAGRADEARAIRRRRARPSISMSRRCMADASIMHPEGKWTGGVHP